MGFLPARMTRILVGGHLSHLEAAIDTLHAEGVVHIEDYADPTATTSIGTPLPRGDQVSAALLRLRGLQKQLGSEGLAAPASSDLKVLEQAEAACAPILDRAARLRGEVAANEAAQQALRPLEGLEVETSLATGLRSVKVVVGTARRDPSQALRAAGVEDFQVVSQGGLWAVAAAVPAKEAAATDRILSEAGFTAVPVPPGKGSPSERLAHLAVERSRLAADLTLADAEIAVQRAAWGRELAGLEAHLQSEVERTQAPLHFGVTSTTFHIEGWVPRTSLNRVQNALASKFGDQLYVNELGDAGDGHGAHGHTEATHGGNHGGQPDGARANGRAHGNGHAGKAAPAAILASSHEELHARGIPHGHDSSGNAVAGHGAGNGPGHAAHGDGGGHDAHDDPAAQPPVALQNPRIAGPYEWLLGLLAKPKYNEVDPTILMLVFFPLFFGLMVGDVAVGVAIILLGIYLKRHALVGIGGPAVGRSLVAGGIVSVIVGAFVFGEALGIHFVVSDEALEEGEMSWEMVLGLHIPYASETHGLLYKSGAAGGHGEDTPSDVAPGPAPVETTTGSPDIPAESPAMTPTDTTAGTMAPMAGEVTEHHGPFAPHSDVHLMMGPVPLGVYSKVHDVQPLLLWSLVIGAVHIVLGLLIGIRNVYVAHGPALAVQEKAAWLGLMAGVAIWLTGPLGGYGMPTSPIGMVGLGLAVFSLGLLWVGAQKVLGQGFIAILEIPTLIGNIVSYTRLAAIGVSKAGLVIALSAVAFTIMGGGFGGWLVYILGFVGIVLLAVLSAGLQALRLQFVEFFGKFFTGGGRPYVPFGRRAA